MTIRKRKLTPMVIYTFLALVFGSPAQAEGSTPSTPAATVKPEFSVILLSETLTFVPAKKEELYVDIKNDTDKIAQVISMKIRHPGVVSYDITHFLHLNSRVA